MFFNIAPVEIDSSTRRNDLKRAPKLTRKIDSKRKGVTTWCFTTTSAGMWRSTILDAANHFE